MMITQRGRKLQTEKIYEQKIGAKLAQVGMLSRAFAIQSFNKNVTEITPEQSVVLTALIENGDLYQRQIAAITLKDRANITRIINILEKQGFVTRTTESKGRQVQKVSITKKGEEIFNKALPHILDIWSKIVENIDEEEINNFVQTLQKIKINLEKYTTLNL